MFSYTGLTVDQALAIRERHHVYMLQSGRISLSGCKSTKTPVDWVFELIVRSELYKRPLHCEGD